MSNRYLIKSLLIPAVIRKARFVDTGGHRVPFDTTRVSAEGETTLPFLDGPGGDPIDVELSGKADQDARVTLKSGAFDRIVVTGRNNDFTGTLWLRVRQGRKVIFLKKLELAKFSAGDGSFETRQFRLNFALQEGENIDIDIEKLPVSKDEDAPTGSFEVRAMGATGQIRTAQEVRNDGETGELETINDEEVDNEGTELRGSLPRPFDSNKGVHSEWFETERGNFIETYSGNPNVDPDAPKILLKA